MDKRIKTLLDNEKIEYAGFIPFSECTVINQPMLDRYCAGKEIKSALMLSVPYYAGDFPERNVSLYAVPRDYHLYFKQLYSRLVPALEEMFPGKFFRGFADSSPIGETGAAAKAGLGVIGDRFQVINEKYGSYTFIGEILTDLVPEEYDTVGVKLCPHCGACSRACPVKDGCLSEMTQRKGDPDPETVRLIRKTGIAWGCDICRTSCPMNRNAAITPIEFFREDLTPVVTAEMIEGMSKAEFLERAYSWRGKKTILRNIISLTGK